MALQEDYEYSAFRCAFCNFFNPAKKCRPIAPRLPIEMTPTFNIQRPSTSDSSNSGDSELEVPDRKDAKSEDEIETQALLSEENKDDEVIEPETIGDEIEFGEKPERKDIEKKLE